MDAIVIGPQQWDLVTRALPNLVLFVGMMVCTAIPFLLSHAVIPSLETTLGLEGEFRFHRTVLYAVSAVALFLMAAALYRAVGLMATMLRDFYPRFTI